MISGLRKNWIQYLIILISAFVAYYYSTGKYPNLIYSKIQGLLPKAIIFTFIAEMIYRISPLKKVVSLSQNPLLKKENGDTFVLVCLLFFCIVISFSMLFEKWTSLNPGEFSVYNGYFTQGGFLPHSDALGYLWGVQTFNAFGDIVSTSIYRPIGTLFYAVIFKLCEGDLIAFYHCITFLLALSIYFVCQKVYSSFGITAAVLMMVLLLQYSLSFSGNFMTENPGMIFGNTAFALLWDGVMKRRKLSFYLGLFCIGIALNIRAGAMFLLPLLLLIPGILFKEGTHKINFRQMTLAICIATASMFTTNAVLFLLENKPRQESNFGYLLYQLHVGSDTWSAVNTDHPEFTKPGVSFEEGVRKVNDLAKAKFREDPWPVFKSLKRLYARVFSTPFDFLFHFNYLLAKGKMLFFVLCSFAVFFIARRTEEKCLFILILLGIAGTFLSSPFMEEIRVRAYAASIAFNCAMPVIGMAMLIRLIGMLKDRFMGQKTSDKKTSAKSMKKKNMSAALSNGKGSWKDVLNPGALYLKISNGSLGEKRENDFLLIGFTVFILFLGIAGPIIIDKTRKSTPSIAPDKNACKKHPFVFDVASSPYIKIIPDAETSDLPNVKRKTIFANNSPRGVMPMEGFYLVSAINLADRNDRGLVYFKSDVFEKHKSGYAVMCLDTVKGDGNLMYYGDLEKVVQLK